MGEQVHQVQIGERMKDESVIGPILAVIGIVMSSAACAADDVEDRSFWLTRPEVAPVCDEQLSDGAPVRLLKMTRDLGLALVACTVDSSLIFAYDRSDAEAGGLVMLPQPGRVPTPVVRGELGASHKGGRLYLQQTFIFPNPVRCGERAIYVFDGVQPVLHQMEHRLCAAASDDVAWQPVFQAGGTESLPSVQDAWREFRSDFLHEPQSALLTRMAGTRFVDGATGVAIPIDAEARTEVIDELLHDPVTWPFAGSAERRPLASWVHQFLLLPDTRIPALQVGRLRLGFVPGESKPELRVLQVEVSGLAGAGSADPPMAAMPRNRPSK